MDLWIEVSVVTCVVSHTVPSPLGGDVIHLWLVSLNVSAATVNRLWSLLSPNERVRAARYHAEIHRRRFVVRRARLRALLASYLDCPPAAVELEEVAGGKPHLVPAAGSTGPVEFSSSHSGELAAIAVGKRAVGVDIEWIDETVDVESVMSSFTASERAVISAGGAQTRRRRFFECWTCKEAYTKVTGSGLAAPLDAFDVSEALECRGAARVDTGEGSGATVAVELLRAPWGYAMALARELVTTNEV